MNVSRWGPSAWLWLHGLSDRLPATLSAKQLQSLVDLSRQLELILPCIHCRHSYGQYYKMVPLEKILTQDRPFRILWDWWLWTIHNKVNEKLEKPHYPFNRLEQSFYRGHSSETWRKACWDFLFSLCYNYQPEKKEIYQQFFAHCLPNLCQGLKSGLGNLLASELMEQPPSLTDQESLTRWLFSLNQECANQPCEPYQQLCQRFETYRAQSCSKKGCH